MPCLCGGPASASATFDADLQALDEARASIAAPPSARPPGFGVFVLIGLLPSYIFCCCGLTSLCRGRADGRTDDSSAHAPSSACGRRGWRPLGCALASLVPGPAGLLRVRPLPSAQFARMANRLLVGRRVGTGHLVVDRAERRRAAHAARHSADGRRRHSHRQRDPLRVHRGHGAHRLHGDRDASTGHSSSSAPCASCVPRCWPRRSPSSLLPCEHREAAAGDSCGCCGWRRASSSSASDRLAHSSDQPRAPRL